MSTTRTTTVHVRATCDRCGTEHCRETAPDGGDAPPEGWARLPGMELCPPCAREYWELHRHFLGEAPAALLERVAVEIGLVPTEHDHLRHRRVIPANNPYLGNAEHLEVPWDASPRP